MIIAYCGKCKKKHEGADFGVLMQNKIVECPSCSSDRKFHFEEDNQFFEEKERDNMRTLYEIIESAKDGNMPSHEECYWAMLCYESMFSIDHRALREALLNEKPIQEFFRKLKAESSFDMYKNALNKPPKEFLGTNNDPSNPGYQEFRKIGKKLIDKFINKEGEKP